VSRTVYQWLLSRLKQQYNSDEIFYMDEAGINSTERYPRGWEKQGKRCEQARPGGYGKRRNFISAIRASDKDWQVPWVITGTVNRTVVEHWLTAFGDDLRKTMAQPSSVVLIMDNASFHKGGKLRGIARRYGIRLLYLPAYSPDLNPIERCWARLKHQIRLLLGNGETLDDAIDTMFRDVVI